MLLKLSRLRFFLPTGLNLSDLKGERSPETRREIEAPDRQIHLLI
jgi:hypothetical protein